MSEQRNNEHNIRLYNISFKPDGEGRAVLKFVYGYNKQIPYPYITITFNECTYEYDNGVVLFDINISDGVNEKYYTCPLELKNCKDINIFSDFFTGKINSFDKKKVKERVLYLFTYVLACGIRNGAIRNSNDKFYEYLYNKNDIKDVLKNVDEEFSESEDAWKTNYDVTKKNIMTLSIVNPFNNFVNDTQAGFELEKEQNDVNINQVAVMVESLEDKNNNIETKYSLSYLCGQCMDFCKNHCC